MKDEEEEDCKDKVDFCLLLRVEVKTMTGDCCLLMVFIKRIILPDGQTRLSYTKKNVKIIQI